MSCYQRISVWLSPAHHHMLDQHLLSFIYSVFWDNDTLLHMFITFHQDTLWLKLFQSIFKDVRDAPASISHT